MNGFSAEPVFTVIVELQEPDDIIARSQRYKRHGFIPLPVTPVTGTHLAVFFSGGSEKVCCAIGPEASVFGEERQSRVGFAPNNISAHAFQDRAAIGIAYELSCCVARTQGPFSLYELPGKTNSLIIGEIFAFPKPDSHGVETGELLD